MATGQDGVFGERGEREDGDGVSVAGGDKREGGVRDGGPGALVEVGREGWEGGDFGCSRGGRGGRG